MRCRGNFFQKTILALVLWAVFFGCSECVGASFRYSRKQLHMLYQIDRLLLQRKNVKQMSSLHHELRACVFPLEGAKHYRLDFPLPRIQEGKYSFNPCNPAIGIFRDGYICIVRLVSYSFSESRGRGSYWIDPSFPYNLTKNVILFLRPDFSIYKVMPIEASLADTGKNSCPMGIFDIRIISLAASGQSISIMASSHEQNEYGISQMAFGLLQEEKNRYRLTKFVPIHGPNALRPEKNWMAYEVQNGLEAIYSYDPLKIYAINKDTGAIKLCCKRRIKQNFSMALGSAPPIVWKNGRLLIIHEKSSSEWGVLYTHRFLWISKSGKIKKASLPFVFRHRGIEFCCGMTFDHFHQNLIISYGVEDQEAYIAKVPLDVVQRMLIPV